MFWGDPHIQTFDKARPSFYGEGEFWIVKSATVHIQGRYMGTVYTHGLAATNKIVVGGPFLKGHTIAVGPLEGEGSGIFVDGKPELSSLSSTFNVHGLATLTYDSSGKLVDEAQSKFGKHIVHMDLPLGVRVTVDRWKNYLDLKIQMTPQPDQDGSCGNFNGSPADDTTEAIFGRIGARVAPDDLLFHEHTHVHFTPEMWKMMLADCAPEKLKHGKSKCQTEMPASEMKSKEMNACIFDHCYGANEHALRYAKTFA